MGCLRPILIRCYFFIQALWEALGLGSQNTPDPSQLDRLGSVYTAYLVFLMKIIDFQATIKAVYFCRPSLNIFLLLV